MLQGAPSCPTAASRGGWERCAAPGADADTDADGSDSSNNSDAGSVLTTASNAMLSFPSGLPYVAARGGVVVTAPSAFGSASAAAAASAGDAAALAGLPRVTLGGELCSGPCVDAGGAELCAVAAPGGDATLRECAPAVRVPPALTQCGAAAAAAAAARTGGADASGGDASVESAEAALSVYRRCVLLQGSEFCLLVSSAAAGGAGAGFGGPAAWVRCPLAGGARGAAAPGEQLAPRGAVSGGSSGSSGTMCAFPFRYNGLARSDCVDPAGAPRLAGASAASPAAAPARCALSLAVDDGDGDPATSSPLRVVAPDDLSLACADPTRAPSPADANVNSGGGGGGGDDAALAEAAADYWQPASPAGYRAGALRPPERATRRYTADRRPCLAVAASPLTGAAEAAAVGAAATAGVVGATPGGGQCVLDPETAEFECLAGADGGAARCAPLARTALSGARCRFPFLFAGASRDDCVWVGGADACRTEEGMWEACASDYVTQWRAAGDGGSKNGPARRCGCLPAGWRASGVCVWGGALGCSALLAALRLSQS